MIAFRMAAGIALLAGAAQAGDGRDPAQVAAGLPQSTVARIQSGPERYAERTAEIIAGYGGADGIDANGIARYIAVTRAEARARRMGEMLAADLDNDGTITADEVASLAPLLDARQRGRLTQAHRRGDGDSDGVLTAAELQAVGEAAARRRIGAQAATALQALMAFDLDANGSVSTTELGQVVAAVLRLAPVAGQPDPRGS
jgi:Ca2+-binding EF-hand superfamily protein